MTTASATSTTAETGYVHLSSGLDMYYETHGATRPDQFSLVLLHGALSATETSFGALLPGLATGRRVISLEQQAHGHTADIDRPLNVEQMADDTAEAVRQLGITQADFFGYSMGAGIALQLAIRHPDLVRKVVLASVSYTRAGFHPGLLEGIDQLQPEHLAGTPWQQEYARVAPRPEDFPTMVAKVKQLDREVIDISPDVIRAIKAPVLLMIGDSDIVTPEHAVEMFRLFGGGVPGDTAGLPNSQLAILPGTTHVSIVSRSDLLLPMISTFLSAPMPI